MSGTVDLPAELWTKIFRFATFPEATNCPSKAFPSTLCAKNETTLLDVLGGDRTSAERYTHYRTKRSLSLVNWAFNHLIQEFLFDILHISDEKTAEYLATLIDAHESGRHPVGIRNWVRQIAIVPPSRFSSASCQRLAAAVIRIISRLHRLEVFFLRWKSPRICEEQVVDALPPSLKHFEWHNPGGGFSASPKRSLPQFLHKLKNNIEVICVSGYLPLPGPSNCVDANDSGNCEFPSLKQLSVHREFYCDLHLINTWITSNNLTCLSLGTFWSYPRTRDPQCSFFKMPLPSLQCLHLGKLARMSPVLLQTILGSTTHLRSLEYTFAGDLDVHNWEDIEHHNLKSLEIHLHLPWDFHAIDDHLRPFAAPDCLCMGGQPRRFNSLETLRFIITIPGLLGGWQSTEDNKSKLKEFIRSVMGFATSIALEFGDGAS